MDAITSFRGKYRFLSNFEPCDIYVDGMRYSSVEHAYQAAKSFDIRVRRKIQAAPGTAKARQIGETTLQLVPREDWGSVHTQINENGDLFWSRTYHKRQNKLGGMLTRIRAELQEERG